jgi:hypothetical protein
MIFSYCYSSFRIPDTLWLTSSLLTLDRRGVCFNVCIKSLVIHGNSGTERGCSFRDMRSKVADKMTLSFIRSALLAVLLGLASTTALVVPPSIRYVELVEATILEPIR